MKVGDESQIEIKEITNGQIEICRDLCNALMNFQADRSFIRTDVLNEMSFDNRLKPSFENAQIKKLLVAFDNQDPIGYVFAEVADITEEAKDYVPDWAKRIFKKGQLIFFSPEQKYPARVGTYNNIYIKPEYHGLGLGDRLTQKIMNWMKSIDQINGIYVYVSNGNEQVADFYRKYGFEFSHKVLGGFITAYYQDVLSRY
ncbi:MAG: GNAT family N-acetyltransferase [Bacteroidales bacterium]